MQSVVVASDLLPAEATSPAVVPDNGDGVMRTAAPEAPRIRVFVSYSRKDAPFVRRLAGALDERGFVVDFDLADRGPASDLGISAQDEWWLRLKEMIAAADVMVFAISPDSAASRVCDDEIAHASHLGKRVIPIVRRAIDFDHAPERLRALNAALSFENDDAGSFARALDRLCAELRLDIDWHRRATRITRLAQQWNDDGRPPGQLLRAGAIADADEWAARRPTDAPTPGPLVLDFLAASRQKEEQDRARLESSELSARLQTADALFERAVVYLERAERHRACESLFDAARIASPGGVPEQFARSVTNEGWARKAWTAAACVSAALPERIAVYGMKKRSLVAQCVWFDEGRHVLLAPGQAHRTGFLGRAQTETLRLEHGHARLVWSRTRESAIVGIAGAGAAPKHCVLGADGVLECVDDVTGIVTHAEFQLKREHDYVEAAVGITDSGDALVIARALPDDDGVVAEIIPWNRVPGPVALSVRINGPRKRPRLARFTADGRRFAVLCDDGLHLFDREGRSSGELKGTGGPAACIAPDFSAFAKPEWDLVQLFRPATQRSPLNGANKPVFETVLLEGAADLVGDVIFVRNAVLAIDLAGHVLEWRLEGELERTLSSGTVTMRQTFGRANRVEPSTRLDVVTNAAAIAAHPTQPDDVLILGKSGLEHWRLLERSKPIETFHTLGPCARTVFGGRSGTIGVATGQGVWTRAIDDRGGTGMTINCGAPVRDIAIEDDSLAAACADGLVRIWRLPAGEEIAKISVEDQPLAILFAQGAESLYIGLHNGVLWEWSRANGMARVAALGIGPIRHLRISADGRVGVAAGKTSDEDEDYDRMHGGVAVWSPPERRLVWTSARYELRPQGVDVSRDGAVLFVAHQHEAVAIDTSRGAVLSRMRPPQVDASKPDEITAICAGPDGRTALLGLWDGSICTRGRALRARDHCR